MQTEVRQTIIERWLSFSGVLFMPRRRWNVRAYTKSLLTLYLTNSLREFQQINGHNPKRVRMASIEYVNSRQLEQRILMSHSHHYYPTNTTTTSSIYQQAYLSFIPGLHIIWWLLCFFRRWKMRSMRIMQRATISCYKEHEVRFYSSRFTSIALWWWAICNLNQLNCSRFWMMHVHTVCIVWVEQN